MAQFVAITHPELAKPATVTTEAFALIYQAKGWQLADPADPAAAGAQPEPAPTDPSPVIDDEAAGAAAAPPTPTPPARNFLES